MSITFAAIELLPGESEHQGIFAFFKQAEAFGLKFRILEPYGPLTIGRLRFLRFRTDCPNMSQMVPFFQEENRSVVIPGKNGYEICTQTTRGKVPISQMQAARLPNYKRKYRGNGDKFWTRQFT